MLKFRSNLYELSNTTLQKNIYSGCPHGGVVSPALWNMVVDELLVLLNSSGIWALGYADGSELMQNTLSSIQTMLSTNKRLIGMRTLTLFNKPKFKVKYLGVHTDNKLNWKSHTETKKNKSTLLWLQCNRVTGVKWGVHPRFIFWIFNAIIKPIFLHGVIVWWKFFEAYDIHMISNVTYLD